MQRELIGNVVLHQDDIVMYCQRATFHTMANFIQAAGRVRIIQADTMLLTGDSGVYYGNTKRAIMYGKVKLDDRTIILNTNKLDYDLIKKNAVYTTGATIKNEESILKSLIGTYNTTNKEFLFQQNVSVTDKKDGKLTADSLRYNTDTKIARFICPTTITTKKDVIVTSQGTYNTKTKSSNFFSRTTAKLEDFDLTGDTLTYDSKDKIGNAKGNVEFYSKKDKVFLYGDVGIYNGKSGVSRVFKNAWMKSMMDSDSLLLKADTLVSVENKTDSTRKLYAYHHVLMFKTDFSGKCDSLTYEDSLIHFFNKPILWTENSQVVADTIHLFLKDKKLNLMDLRSHAFVISKDSLMQANQVKGRKMWVYFNQDNKLEKVDVDGNGESVYYVVDEKKKTTGLNRVEAGKMNIYFKDNSVNRITFITRPEGKFIPPKELTADLMELDGYNWREKERPVKESIEPGKGKKSPLVD